MKPTLGRLLGTVIVGAILLYLIWWVVGVLAVVVLVMVGVKVWQWATAIRPPKPGSIATIKARADSSIGRYAGRWSMRQGFDEYPAGPQRVTLKAVRLAAASPDPASTRPSRRLWEMPHGG